MRLGIIGMMCEKCGSPVPFVNKNGRSKRDLRFCSRACYCARDSHTVPTEIRFWNKVNKYGPVHSIHGQCWVWVGWSNEKGYGSMSVKRKEVKVHRYSWELHNGPAGDLFVLHKCDNPACVRPDHLFLGTNNDNVEDMVNKERQQRGNNHYSAILTEDIVRLARARYRPWSKTDGIAAMAKEFGVEYDTLKLAIKGKNWKHVV